MLCCATVSLPKRLRVRRLRHNALRTSPRRPHTITQRHPFPEGTPGLRFLQVDAERRRSKCWGWLWRKGEIPSLAGEWKIGPEQKWFLFLLFSFLGMYSVLQMNCVNKKRKIWISCLFRNSIHLNYWNVIEKKRNSNLHNRFASFHILMKYSNWKLRNSFLIIKRKLCFSLEPVSIWINSHNRIPPTNYRW